MIAYDNCTPELKDFLTYLEVIKGKSKNTVKAYYYDLNLFYRYIKIKNSNNLSIDKINEIDISDIPFKWIKKIRLSDLYDFMNYVNQNRSNSSSARARKVSCLKTFFKYLTNKAELIDIDPTLELDAPKISKKLPKYLDLDSSIQLLNTAQSNNQRDFCILTLLLNCGLRVSELVGINNTDIRGDNLRVTGKGDKERQVFLNSACLKAIEEYKAVRPKAKPTSSNAFFLNKNNERIGVRGVQMIVKKYLMLSGLDYTTYSTHKLRHTAATLMYKYGNVDVLALQKILGHTNLSTTQIYTHTDEKQIKDAMNKNPLAKFDEKK
ncbi:MAG: tyrosine recombinase XerC [Clostridia bacterium]|nr:tyrosine recombinase XerC [Clostridia bacterium]